MLDLAWTPVWGRAESRGSSCASGTGSLVVSTNFQPTEKGSCDFLVCQNCVFSPHDFYHLKHKHTHTGNTNIKLFNFLSNLFNITIKNNLFLSFLFLSPCCMLYPMSLNSILSNHLSWRVCSCRGVDVNVFQYFQNDFLFIL